MLALGLGLGLRLGLGCKQSYQCFKEMWVFSTPQVGIVANENFQLIFRH